MTYTYAILDLSPEAYAEIHRKLETAGYADQFHKENGRIVIDMHGIAVAEEQLTGEHLRCALH